MPDIDGRIWSKNVFICKINLTNKEMVITTKQKALINLFNDWTAKSEMVGIYKLLGETKINMPYFSL